MAGALSGKGCEYCRRRKKKCDQLRPACTRCSKLRIPCVGAGEQRYKFVRHKITNSSREKAPTTDSREEYNVKEWSKNTIIARPPSNELDPSRIRLISALDTSDLRYNLSCYGDFLKHLPKQLGEDKALDFSVRALVSAYTYHHTRQQKCDALADYVEALRELRLSLDHTKKPVTAELLCAIYLLMISQGWIGQPEQHLASHGEILTHLVNSQDVQTWRSDFELSLLVGLAAPLIIESMVVSTVTLNPWLLGLLYSQRREKRTSFSVPSMHLEKLAKLTSFFGSPEVYADEISSTYCDMLEDGKRLREHLETIDSEIVPPNSLYLGLAEHADRMKHAYPLRVIYSVLLTMAAALNSLCQSLEPKKKTLLVERDMIVASAIALAHQGLQYRPLGASYVPCCLVAMYATADEKVQLAEILSLMAEYQPDYPHIVWQKQAEWMRSIHKPMKLRAAGLPSSEIRQKKRASHDMSLVYCKAALGSIGSYLC